MAQTFSTVISLAPDSKLVQFYQSVGNDKNSLRLDTRSVKTRRLDEEFFDDFTKNLQEYSQANPSYSGKAASVTVVLPNRLVICDNVNVPGNNKRNVLAMAQTAVNARYRNARDLKINQYISVSNKQYSTVNLVILRQKLLQSIYAACATNNMFAGTITFEANCVANAAMALNSKVRGSNSIVMDVKRDRTILGFVAKGMVVGNYDLPFGYSILTPGKVIAENMLFEHSVAELAVLNAKEKAKAKALTMMGNNEENAEGEGDSALNAMMGDTAAPVSDEESAFSAPETPRVVQQQIKQLPKKQPRSLPKFMQRPVPETDEGVVYENFRYFVKWVLEFVRANSRLTAIAAPETVYVNLPSEFDYLYEMANAEKEENKLEFVSMGLDKEKDIIRDNLELYGALFASQYNVNNNF